MIDKLREQLIQDINNSIDNNNEVIWFIPKSDILLCDFTNIKEYIGLLSHNKTLLFKSAQKVLIAIDGYDSDPRGLYEIPEVRRWFSRSMLSAYIPWFYFLKNPDQIQLVLLAFCNIRTLPYNHPQMQASQVQSAQIQTWFKINYDNLEKFIQSNEIPREICLTVLEQAKKVGKLANPPLIFSWKPDLGEHLYKHPQLKKRLLNETFSLIINQFTLAREPEGIEVTTIMSFPFISKTDEDTYCLTLRFPLETDVDLLTHVLKTSWLSFKIIGLGKYHKGQTRERFRPLEVTWIVPENLR